MAQVLVRDLPDDVVERLKARAAASGRSLEAHLREVLAAAAVVDRSDLLDAADEVASTTPTGEQTDAAVLVRATRERTTPT